MGNPHSNVELLEVSQSSLALGLLGQGLVFLALIAFAAAFAMCVLPRWAAARSKLASWLFVLGGIGLFGAFAVVIGLFVGNRFEFEYVWSHGALDHELQYKIAGAWSGQEGSFLLWACTSALFGALALGSVGAQYRRWYLASFALFLAALAGILTYESPFLLHDAIEGVHYVPPDGIGLVPSLMNYWMVIHPPTIFLGFGSLAVLFCWSVSALASQNLKDWLPGVRPWAIVSVTLVGLGLCMGGFWAYETLGWGGFWMWDPVENASFVPWVALVAFVHGAFVQAARGRWQYTNALLAALPFLAFCYGTFLTRSGFLGDTSVHSFAEMDRKALWILLGIGGVAIVGFLALWISRMVAKPPRRLIEGSAPETGWANRSIAYGTAIWFLLAFGVVALVGMSWPLILSVTGRDPSVVEEGLYHDVLGWLLPPTLIVMAVAPLLSWRGLGWKALLVRINYVAAATVFLTGVFLLWVKQPWSGMDANLSQRIQIIGRFELSAGVWITFLVGLLAFIVIANVWRIVELWRRSRSSLGGLLTHVGVAVALAGLIVSRGWEREAEFTVTPDLPAQALGYTVTFDGLQGDLMDRDTSVNLRLVNDEGHEFLLKPNLFFEVDASGGMQPFVWPDILHRATSDLYIVVGEPSTDITGDTKFAIGETISFTDEGGLMYLFTYNGLEMEGEPGAAGTRFVALVDAELPTGRVKSIKPAIEIAAGGVVPQPARLDDRYLLTLVRIDAANKSAVLKVESLLPIFPVVLFYKPLTSLVWIGVGIMTLGGGMAAYSRRAKRQSARDTAADPEITHAPEPVAKV